MLIQTHELGDSYDKGATQRDKRLIDQRRTTATTAKEDYAARIGTAAAALVGALRYGNSSNPRM